MLFLSSVTNAAEIPDAMLKKQIFVKSGGEKRYTSQNYLGNLVSAFKLQAFKNKSRFNVVKSGNLYILDLGSRESYFKLYIDNNNFLKKYEMNNGGVSYRYDDTKPSDMVMMSSLLIGAFVDKDAEKNASQEKLKQDKIQQEKEAKLEAWRKQLPEIKPYGGLEWTDSAEEMIKKLNAIDSIKSVKLGSKEYKIRESDKIVEKKPIDNALEALSIKFDNERRANRIKRETGIKGLVLDSNNPLKLSCRNAGQIPINDRDYTICDPEAGYSTEDIVIAGGKFDLHVRFNADCSKIADEIKNKNIEKYIFGENIILNTMTHVHLSESIGSGLSNEQRNIIYDTVDNKYTKLKENAYSDVKGHSIKYEISDASGKGLFLIMDYENKNIQSSCDENDYIRNYKKLYATEKTKLNADEINKL